MTADPTVHLLAIDWSGLPASVTESLRFRQADIAEILRAACAGQELEMVIVTSRDRFQVYAVGSGRVAAVRSVLRSLLERGRGFIRLGPARVVEASGVAAARELFRSAAGLDGSFALGLRGLYAVTTAAALAAETGTLGVHLGELFAHANRAAWAAHHETELAAPLLPTERRELARFAVERLIEEQLLLWRSAYAEPAAARPSSAPFDAASVFPAEYPDAERSSIVRLKAPAASRESVA